MATIYLAIQESVDRPVALKVMAPMLQAEREFGERFLREARIAAKLQHRNVVAVHDVGRHGDTHYIAMEHLPGGPVHRANPQADVAYALRVTREIATALDYAHSRGVVHRDIKPDNMLLREDGTAVLTDFGIARASDSLRLTMTGAVVGTPQYMSPEQARGKPLDGRADLYSLGIVLYELLTGSPPYQATDPVAIGIMHTTAPRPVLPAKLARLQPLLDKLLAVSPEHRFQRGNDVAAAIEMLEAGVGASGVAASPLPAPSGRVHATSPPPVNTQHSGRVEPNLSDWSAPDLAFERRAPAPPAPGRSRMGAWSLALMFIALAGGGIWLGQDALRGFLPQTLKASLLAQGDAALADGRLAGEDGAVARYRAVLAMDPEHAHARLGMREAGELAKRKAAEALDANELSEASALIELAGELGVAESRLQPLVERLRSPAADASYEALLMQAREALAQNRLRGSEDSAASLFSRALQLKPDDPMARRGLSDTQVALLALVMEQLQAGDLAAGERGISEVELLDPAHPGIPAAKAALSSRLQASRSQIEEQLRAAADLMAKGRLVEGGDNARQHYRALLQANPGLEQAEQGLERIAGLLLQQMERRAANLEIETAGRLLEQAAQTWPTHPGLAAGQRRIQQAAESQRRMAAATQAPSAVDRERIPQLLRDAVKAADAGNLLSPPGASAYDLYRVVLGIEADNAEALAGMAGLTGRAQAAASRALDERQLSRAEGHIEALRTLDPGDAALPGLRRRLAGAFLGLAVERLEGGQLQPARQAVDKAREIDANHPELISVRARVEQAGG